MNDLQLKLVIMYDGKHLLRDTETKKEYEAKRDSYFKELIQHLAIDGYDDDRRGG